MHKRIKRMDIKVSHLKPFDRRFAILPPVESIGYLPRKTTLINQSFRSCNFSFILSGHGEYRLGTVSYAVEAPCVLLQWPDEPMYYGPESSWEELYLIYPRQTQELLRNSKTFCPETAPVRHIPMLSAVREAIDRLAQRLNETPIDPDAVDLACWEMVMASYATPASRPAENPRIDQIERRLQNNLAGHVDYHALAASLGMSLATLRRRWADYHPGMSFSRYRESYFLQESCRRLIESDDLIKEIAAAMGFSDQYYFSRRFRQLARMTPSEYRRRYRVAH